MSSRPQLRISSLAAAHETLTGFVLTGLLSIVTFCVLVGLGVLVHPTRAAVGLNPASDFQIMTWSLRWWPYAISHGLDPLHTRLLWPPEGFSTLWMTTIPALSLLGLPLTLAAGPLVAYNVLMLAAVTLAAGAAYLLCRELTGQTFPAVIGGLLFGFSPYMLGHTLSQHLDLSFVCPVPLMALLVVRFQRGRTSSRRFVVLFTLLLLVLLGVSFELFLDTALLTALAFAFSICTRTHRRAALGVGKLVAFAYALCLPILALIAALALRSPHLPLQYAPSDYSIDLLNIVVPTPTLLAGSARTFEAVSQHFVGNIGEKDGYVGIPILLVALLAVRATWRRGGGLIGTVALAAFVLSLGPILTVGGRPIVDLPLTTANLPLLSSALPARLSVFVALGAACLCALWIAQPGRRRVRCVAGVAVLVTMFPNVVPRHQLAGAWARSNEFGWSTRKVTLGLAASRLVPPHGTVLVLPAGAETQSSYWQVESGMDFALAAPPTPFVPKQIAAEPIVRGIVEGVPPNLAAPRLRTFLRSNRISAVFVALNAGSRWRTIVAEATAAAPLPTKQGNLYRTRGRLAPIDLVGKPLHVRLTSTRGHCRRNATPAVRAWLRFDGRRALLQAQTEPGVAPATLSSPNASADMAAVAADRCGDVAIVFTEWSRGVVELQVATRLSGKWHLVTLDRRTQPIWSPHVIITPGRATLVTWVDEDAPERTVRASALLPGHSWDRPVTLERSDGLGSGGHLSARGGIAVFAWRDQVASESRIRVATHARGRWSHALTLAASLSTLDDISIGSGNPIVVGWNSENAAEQSTGHFEAELRGSTWFETVGKRPRRRGALAYARVRR